MTQKFSRRGFLSISAAFTMFAQGGLAAPPSASLRPVLRSDDLFKQAIPEAAEIIRDKNLSGQVAFALADVSSGAWLESQDELAGMPPASVTKAVTALYALETLGPEHRFETRLAATGGIKEGEIQGDLILIGGNDPTLDTDALAQMAADLKAAGVIGVKGGLKVFQGSLPVMTHIDPAQPDHVGYNPAVSGIALNYNRVHFEWRRASGKYAITMDGRSKKHRPDVRFAAMRIEDRSAPVYTYSDLAGRDQWTVAKGALGGGGARWLPVRKPASYAGEVFSTLAGAHGIRLGSPEVIDTLPPHEVLVRHASQNLRLLLRDMLKWSTNLTAEMVGLASSKKRLGAVTDLRMSANAMNLWAKSALGMQAPALVDHSGLGDDSRLTAADMARALLKANDAGFRSILKSFGFRDARGKPVKDQKIMVDAKTGTLNFVSSLAGYITAQDGREMVFAIFAADMDERSKISREERESPTGGKAWNKRAKRVQQGLIERWDALYGRAKT
ncbi:D-alanyl-D-alanine carboxypeptidase/D-alanyl-D-alanine-endopeptidase [Sulfitobacter sp. F26204]|uniref:D-alanyl-D-alanine carboxypeptidase/D-alanyl-D-alanine endopeptidase n=1 Tax=Sulfitobacter sp. F26204 TaxID=2996014 RepID=UPI00225DFEC1|nr:D-alanyl-D-alanine carboxypeptidase/D-alanyl-D-alanine-endopeptidase [Sulfitobacter sp. F26204]MCX7560372.1 D-alanyl-D-alanine carboxypeptidase/D-alanyl-D-alanine-endopeptidase [Sulfitobacter sp. F26204]